MPAIYMSYRDQPDKELKCDYCRGDHRHDGEIRTRYYVLENQRDILHSRMVLRILLDTDCLKHAELYVREERCGHAMYILPREVHG